MDDFYKYKGFPLFMEGRAWPQEATEATGEHKATQVPVCIWLPTKAWREASKLDFNNKKTFPDQFMKMETIAK